MTAQTTLPVDTSPAAGLVDAPAAPAPRTPGRTRRWLAGTTLVTVGLVAGAGTTYAVTTATGPDLGVTAGAAAPALDRGPLGTLTERTRSGGTSAAATGDGEPT